MSNKNKTGKFSSSSSLTAAVNAFGDTKLGSDRVEENLKRPDLKPYADDPIKTKSETSSFVSDSIWNKRNLRLKDLYCE